MKISNLGYKIRNTYTFERHFSTKSAKMVILSRNHLPTSCLNPCNFVMYN